MKLIIWKKKQNQFDDQPRWRIASLGFGEGYMCLGNAPVRHIVTISIRRSIFRFRREYKRWWACLLGLEISAKR